MTHFTKNKLKKLFFAIRDLFYWDGPQHIEVDDAGFFVVTETWFGNKKGRKILWNSVLKVNAHQTDYGMMLEFIFETIRPYFVHDTIDNWDDFVKLASEKLLGFNLNNFRLVESFTLGILPCWDSERKIGNIRADEKQGLLLWEDGGIFSKLNEDPLSLH